MALPQSMIDSITLVVLTHFEAFTDEQRALLVKTALDWAATNNSPAIPPPHRLMELCGMVPTLAQEREKAIAPLDGVEKR